MKSVARLFCAIAATQLTGLASGAASVEQSLTLANPAAQILSAETELTNPAAPISRAEAELFRSVVPGADSGVVPSTFNVGGCCDSAFDCGSGLGNGCDCGDGCGCGAGVGGFFVGAGNGPLWKASAGGVVLSRSQPVPSVIAEPLAGVGLRATDFSIGTTVGVDLSISRRITAKGSLEARYLGALEWDPRAEFTGLSNIDLGGIDLNGITGIGGGYNSTLHSSEFNWRHQQSERFSWLVGFRWIELQDTVDFFVTTGLGSLALDWNTNNHLYGGQLGGDYLFWKSAARPLTLTGSAKGGVYGNVADNDFSQFVGPVQVASGGGFGSETALVTDLAVWATYQLSDRWSVRAGGQFLYIDGVAIASDQIAASLVQDDTDAFDSEGYVYYTGGMVSLDCVW